MTLMRTPPQSPEPSGISARATAMLAVLALALAAGCAKIGDPQPPRIRIPKPAGDLAAHQVADSVELTVSVPAQNTDGSAATTLRQVDVLRLAEDAGKNEQTGPVPEEEFMKQAVRILSIPESRFLSYRRENSFIIRDSLDFPQKSVIYSSGFRYAVLFINDRNQAAGLSNQAFIRPVPIPRAPADISTEVTESSINLRWQRPAENMDGSTPARIAGFNIYRSEEAGAFPPAPLNAVPAQNPAYEDHDFKFDQTYFYAVSTVGNAENPHAESPLSDALKVVSRDVFAPAPPREFTAVADGKDIILLWSPSPSTDVAGYRIYRLEDGKAPGTLLQNELINNLSYRDTRLEGKWKYSIRAVDAHGNESPPVLAPLDDR